VKYTQNRIKLISLVGDILTNGSNQIYGMSKSHSKYVSYSRLLESKFLKTDKLHKCLLPKVIEEITGETITESDKPEVCPDSELSEVVSKHTKLNKPKYLIIQDGSEIRKPESEEMEKLQKVRALDGKLVNGFRSVASIAVSEDNQECFLLEMNTFSCKEKGYVSDNAIELKMIKNASKLRSIASLVYVLDRRYDSFNFMDQINVQKDKFIIRVKSLDRKVFTTKKGFKSNLPLPKKTLEAIAADKIIETRCGQFPIKESNIVKVKELRLKCGTFYNVKVHYWHNEILIPDPLGIKGNIPCTAIQVQLRDSKNKLIYVNPMYLVTNQVGLTKQEVIDTYFHYLQRHGIEQVFKFMKTTLNLEKFQIKKLKLIKKLISITFLASAYFYMNRRGILEDPVLLEEIKQICELGKGKGKIGLKYLKQGIESLNNIFLVLEWKKQHNISDEKIIQIAKRYGFYLESGLV
jgi:hypothetical protein